MAIIPAEEKVFMVSNSTNTTYSGSAALKAMQQWYTMEDVTNTVKPYKVFTALLTQSGGSALDDAEGGDTLTLGVTYLITSNPDNEDLTVFGAPNSELGTSFICTYAGTLISANLQFNTGAPVATVLENTIGNVWFTYESEGTYIINSNDLFTTNKTYVTIQSQAVDLIGDNIKFALIKYPTIVTDSIIVQTGIATLQEFNDFLSNTPIEIRVYN
jgi:hypothetical protein